MKPIKKAMLLTVVVLSIITFWLSPLINSAKDASYVRYYEDTDRMPLDEFQPGDTILRRDRSSYRRVYKTETIKSTDKLSELSPKYFSRAAQYEASVAYDSIVGDSVLVLTFFQQERSDTLTKLSKRTNRPETRK